MPLPRPHPMPAVLALALSTGLAAMTTHAASQRLTIYSGDYESVSQSDAGPGGSGYALVERRLRVDPASNGGAFAIDDVPRAIDASTVSLEAEGLQVRGQRFDFAGLQQAQLLERSIGHTISVEQAVGNEVRRHTGVLLAAGNGLTLREADGSVRVLSGYSSFTLATPPEGLVARPTLHFQLAGRAGDATLGYATAGLAWRAEYRAVLSGAEGACRMALEGHAMVANRSGLDYRDAQLTLVAGEPNRVRGGGPDPRFQMRAAAAPAKMLEADAAVEATPSGEYHAYALPGTGDLPDGSLQRLPLIAPARGVACTRRYTAESSFGDWMPDRPIVQRDFGGTGEVEVQSRLDFRNETAQGLGLPLPAGRVRVFDGRALLGESSLGHTAVGREVRLALGKSFDLSAERRSVDFALDRAGRTLTETVEWVLRNGKRDAATVQVGDRLPRWTDWQLVEGGEAFRKVDAQRIEAQVRVPAGGETIVRYTVRYRWANDIAID